MKYFIFLLLVFALIFEACGDKDGSVCPTEFELPGIVTPYQDTFYVGDTINLSNNFYRILKETNSDEVYDLYDVSFYSSFGIYKIDLGNNIQIARKNYINLIKSNDTSSYWHEYSSTNDEILLAKLIKSNDTLKFDLQISLTTPGLFLIEFGSGQMESDQYFEGKCSNVSFDAYTRLNGSKDNNINLLKQTSNEYYRDWIFNQRERFYKRGSFVIRVIE